MSDRKYRIKVVNDWEYIVEVKDGPSEWEPLCRGMMGRPIGHTSKAFAMAEIEKDRRLRAIPDRIIEVS